MIDLYTLTENRIAVRCKTEKAAQEFLSMMFALLPQACRHWHEGGTNWGVYREDTCYALFVNRDWDREPTLYYSPSRYYKDAGYEIVEYDEVVFATPDLGALDLSVADLSYLFGLEVATND